jgi:hypothetical protein
MVTTLPAGYGNNPIIGEVSNMAIAGTDVYITYGNGLNSVCWMNGTTSPISLSGIALAINGTDMYFAGQNMQSTAAYLKNGTMYSLPSAGQSLITAMAISGTDVYFAGADSKKNGFFPVDWKNGTEYFLPTTNTPAQGSVYGMAVSGTDVYFAGNDEGSYGPVYWKNGKENTLPIMGINGQVTAMTVSGPDVYIAGVDFRTAAYWKNGVETILPFSNSSSSSSAAFKIAIAGTMYT